MKKCKDCNREIDKYMIVCDYCGKLTKHEGETRREEQEQEEKDKNKDNE